jgi:uncharacterized membrane protein
MKRRWEVLKTTLVAGLFVLLPVVVIAKVLAEVVHFSHKAAAPIIKLLPKQITAHPKFPVVFAIVVVCLACFFAGLLTRLAFAQSIGRWIERRFLESVPGYSAIRNFTRGLTGSSDESAFKAAALISPEGGSELVYLIEDHGNGLATIMIPSAPNPMGRAIKVVPRDRIKILDVKVSAIARVLSQWGVGAQALLPKGKLP